MNAMFKRCHTQVMEMARAGQFSEALAQWDGTDRTAGPLGVSEMAFFLQERGILKQLTNDLHGALVDLTDATEEFFAIRRV
ncbi:unnamed protein product [Calypogeia fissa]